MTSEHPLIKYGLFCFIVGTTIGFGSVNVATISIIPYLRAFALSLAALVLLFYASNLKVSYRILISFVAVFFMNCYGLLRGLDNIDHVNYIPNLVTSTIITLTGIGYIGISKSEHTQIYVTIYFAIFATLWLIFIISTGGLDLNNASGFNFQIYLQDGREVSYSQGISKFYGLAGIATTWSAARAKSSSGRKILYALSVLFVFLSFFGGGRGDFLAAVIVIILIMLSNSWRGAIAATLLAIIFLVLFFEYIPRLSDDFVAARRFAVLLAGSNFGMRDILFDESLHIITNEFECFFFGCGFAYFQDYYGYRFGLYPHNILLESVITWGMPLVIVLGFLFALGLLTSDRNYFLTWAGLFFALIGMKSGDVLGSWFALSFVYYYAGSGISVLIGQSRNQGPPERELQ